MTDAPETIAPTRGRPPRVEAERTERRRREDMGPGRRMRLTVTDKDPNYVYRWVNSDPGRVHQLTVEDDWDTVAVNSRDKRNVAVGAVDERVVDRGTGKTAILLRKRKEYYEADKAKEQGFIDAREEGLRHGVSPGQGGLTVAENMYVPEGGISIGRKG